MMDGSRREIPVYMKAAQCKNISSTPGLRARVKNKLSSVYALVVHASSRSCSSAGNCARSAFGRCPCVLLIPPPVCLPLVPGSLHSLVLEQQPLLLRRCDRMGHNQCCTYGIASAPDSPGAHLAREARKPPEITPPFQGVRWLA